MERSTDAITGQLAHQIIRPAYFGPIQGVEQITRPQPRLCRWTVQCDLAYANDSGGQFETILQALWHRDGLSCNTDPAATDTSVAQELLDRKQGRIA